MDCPSCTSYGLTQLLNQVLSHLALAQGSHTTGTARPGRILADVHKLRKQTSQHGFQGINGHRNMQDWNTVLKNDPINDILQ